MSNEIQQFEAAANRFMDEVRGFVLQHWNQGIEAYSKADDSECTEADTGAEQILRQRITDAFPNHGIVGEEYPDLNTSAEYYWVIDPIDGTQNFVNGIPTFGSILALYRNDQPIVGLIDHPALGLRYSAGLGTGTKENGKTLKIKDVDSGARKDWEIISVSTPSRFIPAGEEDIYFELFRRHHTMRVYGDCFPQTRTITNGIGAVIHYDVNLWDIASLPLLIKEAGGTYVFLREKPYQIIAGKPAMVRYVEDLFHEMRSKRPKHSA